MNATPKLASDALDSLVGRLADEFADRLGRGEKPDVEAYAASHPEAGEELRRVLRSVEVMHALRSGAAAQDAPEADGLLALGQLGDYRIVREVGRGGMGIVYEAEQLSLRRRVALKVLPFASVLDPKRLQRFQNEALAAAHLDHPNIVSVHGTGCERGVHFYAMRFIDGRTLAEVIQNLREQAGGPSAGLKREASPAPAVDGGAGNLAATTDQRPRPDPAPAVAPGAPRVPESGCATSPAVRDTHPMAALTTEVSARSGAFCRSVANLGLQVAGALEHAHQCGVLHRDIKPANLLLDAHGTVWISDFGLAHFGTDANLTMTGDLVGTLRYMSPEQALAQRVAVDHRTDIYSLGVTLYELLALRPPFEGRDRQELLRQIAFEEPVLPRRLNKVIPADLETIVLKAMAKNPGERYATARALADDLGRFLADQPIRARRPGLVQRAAKWCRRHRAVVTTAVATFVLALVTATAVVWAERNRTAAAYQGERHERQRAQDNAADAQRQKQQAVEQQQRADQQRDEAERQRQRAERLRELAEQRELTGRQYLYAAQMTLAQHAWERRHIGRMVELLEAQRPRQDRPDLRGFEWYYWWDQCQGDRFTLQKRGQVFASALAPDGRTLATGAPPGEIKVWDVAGRRLRVQLKWPGATVTALAFAPDGRTLAAAGYTGWGNLGTGQIKLWDLANGKDTESFGPPGFEITSLAFSPDGKVLASGETSVVMQSNARGEVTLWDAARGRKLRTCQGPIEAVSGVAFSPDGKTLASCSGARIFPVGSVAGGDAHVRLWDPATGRERVSRNLNGFFASAAAFSPDGKTLALSGSGAVKLCDPATTAEQAELKAGKHMIWSLSFSPDGRTLATANSDDTVRLWDVASRTNFSSKWHDSVTSVAFGPKGQTLASVGRRSVELWTITRRVDHEVWKQHNDWVTSLAFSADGKRLVSGSYDGTATVWQAATGEVEATLGQRAGPGRLLPRFAQQPVARIRALALSPDGKRVAAAGDQLQLWDVAAGRRQAILQGHPTWVMAAAFSPDGALLASADADGRLILWDGRTGAQKATWQVYPPIRPVGPVPPQGGGWNGGANYVTALAFSPDGKVLVAAGLKGVKLWDVKTKRPLAGPKGFTTMHLLCAFSPDGKLLVTAKGFVPGIGNGTGGGGNEITIWDPASGKIRTRFSAHGFTPASVALAPDGKTLATGGTDGSIKLWSVAAWQELATLTGHTGSVLAVAFDPAGQTLASGSADGTVRVWRAPRSDEGPARSP